MYSMLMSLIYTGGLETFFLFHYGEGGAESIQLKKKCSFLRFLSLPDVWPSPIQLTKSTAVKSVPTLKSQLARPMSLTSIIQLKNGTP